MNAPDQESCWCVTWRHGLSDRLEGRTLPHIQSHTFCLRFIRYWAHRRAKPNRTKGTFMRTIESAKRATKKLVLSAMSTLLLILLTATGAAAQTVLAKIPIPSS